MTPLTQPVRKKIGFLALACTLVLGPFGFFYLGWRFGFAALSFFVSVLLCVTQGLQDLVITIAGPTIGCAALIVFWLVQNPVLGYYAMKAVTKHNTAVETGDSQAFKRFSGVDAAFETTLEAFLMAQITAWVVSALLVALKLIFEGKVGFAVAVLLLYAPAMQLCVWVMFAFVSETMSLVCSGIESICERIHEKL